MKFARLAISVLCLGFAVLTQVAYGQDQGCPPNAAPISEKDNIVRCRCVAGFENRNNACVPIKCRPDKPTVTSDECDQWSLMPKGGYCERLCVDKKGHSFCERQLKNKIVRIKCQQ